MERMPVISSNLVSVGYDSDNHILEIEFYNRKGPNGVYQYFDVPPEVHHELMNAGSHGQFFHYNIKGVFAYERVV